MKSRREFLKTSCRALSMAAMATQMRHLGLVNVLAQERMDDGTNPEGGNYKALVCVFLSGGNDSNNMVVPKYQAGYDQYAAARSPFGIAIPQANLLSITPPAMNGLEFGLHPSMTDLHALWGQGRLAVVTNVGTLVQPITRAQYQSGAPRPLQLFSHTDQVRQFQTAISSYLSTTGWGGRVADRTGNLNPGAAISMVTSLFNGGGTIFHTGNTTAPLIVSPAPTPLNQVLTLNGFGTAADELARRTAMNNIRTADLNYSMVQATSVLTQQAVNVSQQLSQNPALTVTFPNTTLGNQLAQVAKLMKFRTQLNMSRQIFFVNVGTFDTHSGQLNGQGSLLTQVSQAMKAFYDETVAQGIADDVTQFTMSDFNRTFNPNGSGGTDHAWGGHHLVLGGAVAGGNFYGGPTSNGSVFPTLVNSGPDDAETRGRFIPSVPVEAYAATLSRWFGLSATDVPLVFPNITNFPITSLGFLPF